MEWKWIEGARGYGCEIVECTVKDILESKEKQASFQKLIYEKGLVLIRAGTELTPGEEVALMKLLPYDDSSPLRDVSGPYYAAGTGIMTSLDGVVGASRWKLPDYPVVQIQGQGKVENHHGVVDGLLESRWATCEWHTDGCHDVPSTTLPPVATSMYCMETPKVGAETLFASGKSIFRALPRALRERAMRCECVYDHTFREMQYDGKRIKGNPQDGSKPVSNTWPMVIQDMSGAPSIYVGPAFTKHIVEDGKELTPQESHELLGEILSCGLDNNVYSHSWTPGDLVVWSNRSMLHSATPSDVYGKERRIIHRIRMSSKVPIVPYFSSFAGNDDGKSCRYYVRLWCAQQLLSTGFFNALFGMIMSSSSLAKFSLASEVSMDSLVTVCLWIMIGVQMALPQNKRLILVSHVVNIAVHAYKIPMVWDYDYWDALGELSVVLCGGDVAAAAPLARSQWVSYYYATVFFKLTKSFLNHEVSCAPIFVLSLLDCVWPFRDAPKALIEFAAKTAPAVTVLVEWSIPTLLLFAPLIGVYAGLFFHGLIAMTPPPNNAGGFSVSIAVRYAFFVPAWQSPSPWVRNLAVPLVAAAGVIAVHRGGDWALPLYCVIAFFYLATSTNKTAKRECSGPSSSTSVGKIKYLVMMALTWLYAVVLPILSIHDMGAATMFANFKVYAGSNHITGVPTGFVLRNRFGEVVRIDNSTSVTMNKVHPNEASHLLSPRLSSWLTSSGHSGRQFAPYISRTIGISFTEDFTTPFILPAIEVTRLVHEARERNETFVLEYTKLGLPPLPDDPDYVNTRLPKVYFDEETGDCTIIQEGTSDVPCGPDEPPLAPPLSPLVKSTMLYFSFPVAPDASVNRELGCVC